MNMLKEQEKCNIIKTKMENSKNNNTNNLKPEEQKPEPKQEVKLEIKPEIKAPLKPSEGPSLNKPPLVLIYDPNKIEGAYKHSDLEGIYRLKVGKRKGFDVWIVDGAKVRRELYTDFLFGGNDGRYKFIPKGEIWIDNSISVEEAEFTILHEITECELIRQGMTYTKAHELATLEELKARINKTESIDDLRERWYKLKSNGKEVNKEQELKKEEPKKEEPKKEEPKKQEEMKNKQ